MSWSCADVSYPSWAWRTRGDRMSWRGPRSRLSGLGPVVCWPHSQNHLLHSGMAEPRLWWGSRPRCGDFLARSRQGAGSWPRQLPLAVPWSSLLSWPPHCSPPMWSCSRPAAACPSSGVWDDDDGDGSSGTWCRIAATRRESPCRRSGAGGGLTWSRRSCCHRCRCCNCSADVTWACGPAGSPSGSRRMWRRPPWRQPHDTI